MLKVVFKPENQRWKNINVIGKDIINKYFSIWVHSARH